ncbi:MAG: hypothetical protein WB773_09710, partial [Isosphaeraceae bacterium]
KVGRSVVGSVGHPHLTRNPKIDQGLALTLAADPPKKLLAMNLERTGQNEKVYGEINCRN